MLWCGRLGAVHHLRGHRRCLSLALSSRQWHRGTANTEPPCTMLSTTPLEEVIAFRRQQAQRSLLVEVVGAVSAQDLCHVCGQYGTVEALFHYTVPASGFASKKEMILLEFTEATSINEALRHTVHPPLKDCPPSYTPQVWLSPGLGTTASTTTTTTTTAAAASATTAAALVSTAPVTEEELMKRLAKCSSISEQIQTLYDSQRLTELGWRLRFFTCRQIEVALKGLFPRAAVLPFGSSVNSFGHWDSDLDMTLEFSGDGSEEAMEGSSQLVFQSKALSAPANEKLTLQRRMGVIAGLLNHFMPGCSQVRRNLRARVPIIKYRQDLTAIDCDLTTANRSGYHMSRMLHFYGSCDPRVAPLVCVLRQWARSRRLTSPQAGPWLKNFSLTMLVLTYLMNTSPPLLLPLETLKVTTGSDPETGDPSFTIPPQSTAAATAAAAENTETLEDLLRGFFAYYDKFKFRERGMSIVSGRDFVKPVNCALYIQNPLELDLNVSHNVTLEEVERFSTEVTHSRYLMEAESKGGDGSGTSIVWGVQRLFQHSGTTGTTANSQSVSQLGHTPEGHVASPTPRRQVRVGRGHTQTLHAIDWNAVFRPEDTKHR